MSQYQKGKTSLDFTDWTLLKQETVSGQVPFLPNKNSIKALQAESTEGRQLGL